MHQVLLTQDVPRFVSEGRLDVQPPNRSPMARLSATELATIRLHLPELDAIPEDNGGVCNLAHRIAQWGARGQLRSYSGWSVARRLQELVYPRSRNWRKPMRGFELMRLLDATADQHGLVVAVDLLGVDGYRRTRLGALVSPA
jgi:hypothetical protein